MPAADALARLGSDEAGLSGEEAHRRLALYGANALRSRGVSALSVLVRQVRSYLLGLLLFAAVVSAGLMIAGAATSAIGLRPGTGRVPGGASARRDPEQHRATEPG